ncbi:thioredoxin family protein [Mesomycoplasma ovipneumoniae]|uniref:thioredoxin family protein n=1 Tax=Mesomycoplasma ovipneumoniae TaxID=29562 RepID=UPI00311C9061
MPIFDIHSTDDINQKILTSKSAILVFHQPGCGACVLYEPSIDQMNDKYGLNGLVIIRVNVRENILFARDNQIHGTPTTLFYKDHKLVHRLEGYAPADVLESQLKHFELI